MMVLHMYIYIRVAYLQNIYIYVCICISFFVVGFLPQLPGLENFFKEFRPCMSTLVAFWLWFQLPDYSTGLLWVSQGFIFKYSFFKGSWITQSMDDSCENTVTTSPWIFNLWYNRWYNQLFCISSTFSFFLKAYKLC